MTISILGFIGILLGVIALTAVISVIVYRNNVDLYSEELFDKIDKVYDDVEKIKEDIGNIGK